MLAVNRDQPHGCMCTKTGNQTDIPLFEDHMFHRDAEDFTFLKLFIYLLDVEPKNGAHCYIRGSHHCSELTARGPVKDEDIEYIFPNHKQIIPGKAGSGFLADTWGL
jgi:hypothetical protein